MARKTPDEVPEDDDLSYADHEVTEADIKKVLNTLKTATVREALFVLNAAIETLLRDAPRNLDAFKVKQVLSGL